MHNLCNCIRPNSWDNSYDRCLNVWWSLQRVRFRSNQSDHLAWWVSEIEENFHNRRHFHRVHRWQYSVEYILSKLTKRTKIYMKNVLKYRHNLRIASILTEMGAGESELAKLIFHTIMNYHAPGTRYICSK